MSAYYLGVDNRVIKGAAPTKPVQVGPVELDHHLRYNTALASMNRCMELLMQLAEEETSASAKFALLTAAKAVAAMPVLPGAKETAAVRGSSERSEAGTNHTGATQ